MGVVVFVYRLVMSSATFEAEIMMTNKQFSASFNLRIICLSLEIHCKLNIWGVFELFPRHSPTALESHFP